jgi:hypothetical protein
MTIGRTATNVVLSWTGTGTLQSSTNPAGTYTNINGAVSPFTVTNAAGNPKYFRVKVQ